MPPAGNSETLARWRIAGKWWECEPPTETVRFLDQKGIRRELTRELPILNRPDLTQIEPDCDDHREDYGIRPRKRRDEKVSKACGYIKETSLIVRARPDRVYAPLHVVSGYSFGRSVLLASEIPRLAAKVGIPAVAIVDRFALTGAVEMAREAIKQGIKPLIGASFELADGGEIVLLAKNKTGYRSLSRLITECCLEEPRLYPLCTWDRLSRHTDGLLCLTGGSNGPIDLALIRKDYSAAKNIAHRLISLYQRENVFVEIERSYLPWQIETERKLRSLSDELGLIPVAGGSITHRRPAQFPAQDILACAESLAVVDQVIGRKPARFETQLTGHPIPMRAMNAERFLRTPDEMAALFADSPELLANTMRVVEQCESDVLPGPTRIPLIDPNPDQALRELVYQGAREWHRKVTRGLQARLDFELGRIAALGYSNHFLVACDMCRWANENQIQYSGRGSVVDAAISFCLGFSRIDAYTHNLHFERFLPPDGTKKPDIDIDFEALRRDDIRNYLVQKFGKDHVATVAAIGSYRVRGIVREVGKALGIPDSAISFMAKKLHGGITPQGLYDALSKRPELRDSNISRERFQWVFKLAEDLRDIPRNMRAHSSGVIISETPIADTVPVMHSGSGNDSESFIRIIQWDKRSAKRCFVKFDILCLRGQDVLSGTEKRMREHDSAFRVTKIDPHDPEIYRAMRSSHTVGIPQSASPAMTQAHARLRTQNLQDASLVQAGIRPGVGGAVKLNELIERRLGKPYSFTHPDVEGILGHTYGIIVFQEQVDQLLQTFCGLSGGEAEEMREKIHDERHNDFGESNRDQLIRRAMERGYPRHVAEEMVQHIVGFKGYGFAQGHALAFAEISARSVYCQQNFPAEYFAALLDAQPAGYYGPATLVNEARIRGLKVIGPDVNLSTDRVQVQDVQTANPAIKIPRGGILLDLGQVHGLSKSTLVRTLAANRPFRNLFDFVQQVRPHFDELERLILCGALDALHPNRRAMLWGMNAAFSFARSNDSVADGLPLCLPEPELPSDIPDFTFAEKKLSERGILGLDLDEHIVAYERSRIQAKGGTTAADSRKLPHGTSAFLVGNPIRLRFPPTPTGRRVVFFDLEDETGLMNVTCFDDVYQKYGHAIVLSPYVTVVGKIERRNDYPAFMASAVYPYQPQIFDNADPRRAKLKTADFLVG